MLTCNLDVKSSSLVLVALQRDGKNISATLRGKSKEEIEILPNDTPRFIHSKDPPVRGSILKANYYAHVKLGREELQ